MSRRYALASVAASLAGVSLIVSACSDSGGAGGTSGRSSTAGSGTVTPTAVVSTSSGPMGTYLTDGSGRALYLWVADTTDTSSCSGSCATEWPPLLTNDSPKASGGAMASDLGTTRRADGSEQVTYASHPLYYFAGDTAPGETTGEGSTGFGALWWLVAPSGASVTGGVKATTPRTPANQGGYGY